MSPTRSQRRVLGRLARLAAAVAVVGAVVAGAGLASAQESTTTTEATTTTQSSTTTSSSTTSSTAPVSTTTTIPRSTTTTTARRSSTTSTTAAPSTTSTTIDSASTTSSVPQFLIPQDTLPTRAEVQAQANPGGLSTNAKLGMVVGGLGGVAVLISLLTVLYWRHTRPMLGMAALDTLGEVSAQSGPPTERVPMVGEPGADEPIGPKQPTAPVAAATAGATTGVRVLGPVADDGDDGWARLDTAVVSADEGAASEKDETSADKGSGSADSAADVDEQPDVAEPVAEPLVTLEDLFGPQTDEESRR